MVRKWQPREMRLLSEFLAEHYQGVEYRTRIRLGKIQPRLDGKYITEEERLNLGTFRRWADALVILPDRLILIEAKIRPQPGVISQLQLYKRLLPNTPELQRFRDRPLEMLLVYAIRDDLLISMAREEGIRCIQYRPAWVDEYLKELYPRERRATRSGL